MESVLSVFAVATMPSSANGTSHGEYTAESPLPNGDSVSWPLVPTRHALAIYTWFSIVLARTQKSTRFAP